MHEASSMELHPWPIQSSPNQSSPSHSWTQHIQGSLDSQICHYFQLFLDFHKSYFQQWGCTKFTKLFYLNTCLSFSLPLPTLVRSALSNLSTVSLGPPGFFFNLEFCCCCCSVLIGLGLFETRYLVAQVGLIVTNRPSPYTSQATELQVRDTQWLQVLAALAEDLSS